MAKQICSYKTMLHDTGTPYLVQDTSYPADPLRPYHTPDDLARFILDYLQIQYCAEEYVYGICLDTNCHIIAVFQASHGNVNTSLVSNREILQKALLLGAVSLALTHNHPSGSLIPSDLDIAATKSLKEACSLLGISLLDHIIVSRNGWLSLKNDGLF